MSINIETISIYDKEMLIDDNQNFVTNIKINDIENFINSILDKHKDICKYYFNITENYWAISFNIDISQLEALFKSSFTIFLYKNSDNNAIISISNEINDFEEWSKLNSYLIKKLKI
jgi:hypothetical protein